MPPSDTTTLTFEQALDDLSRILRDLEDGSLTLDDSLATYERGIGLLRQCYSQLKSAEQKVKLLAGIAEDGTLEVKPFEHVSSIETAKASVRRATRNGTDPGIIE